MQKDAEKGKEISVAIKIVLTVLVARALWRLTA